MMSKSNVRYTPVRLNPQLWQEVRKVAGNRKGTEALNEAMKIWLDLNKDKR